MTPRWREALDRALTWLGEHLSQAQHRNAYYLMGSNVIGAAAGLVFWYLVAGVADLSPSRIGIGHAAISLGTTVAVIAKGGLDTALVQAVPDASRQDALRLLRFGVLLGAGVALIVASGLAGASTLVGLLPAIGPLGWVLVAAIALLLVTTWLQDAYFLAERDTKYTMHRNIVFSVARLALPLPIVLLATPHPIEVTWALALGVSALAALLFTQKIPPRQGRVIERLEFVKTSLRNVTGSAAEFLPGLVLVPLVLEVQGAEAAGYFAIAWTAASLLFVASAAIGRSAMTELVRLDPDEQVQAIRKGAFQHLALVGPAALVGLIAAPLLLGIFGPAYAEQAAPTFRILCASILVVAPAYLYLAVLRALDRTVPLIAFPAGMIVALAVLVPLLGARYGQSGFAAAWALANAPFGLYGAWRLKRHGTEVATRESSPSVGGDPHTE